MWYIIIIIIIIKVRLVFCIQLGSKNTKGFFIYLLKWIPDLKLNNLMEHP